MYSCLYSQDQDTCHRKQNKGHSGETKDWCCTVAEKNLIKSVTQRWKRTLRNIRSKIYKARKKKKSFAFFLFSLKRKTWTPNRSKKRKITMNYGNHWKVNLMVFKKWCSWRNWVINGTRRLWSQGKKRMIIVYSVAHVFKVSCWLLGQRTGKAMLFILHRRILLVILTPWILQVLLMLYCISSKLPCCRFMQNLPTWSVEQKVLRFPSFFMSFLVLYKLLLPTLIL